MSDEEDKKISFPVLRRVHPTLIAHDMITIQPMQMPVGNIFLHDYAYGRKIDLSQYKTLNQLIRENFLAESSIWRSDVGKRTIIKNGYYTPVGFWLTQLRNLYEAQKTIDH